MKLIAPITAIIAAASAGNIYAGQSAENYLNSAELYQSAIEHQQQGLYSGQSQAPHYAGHEATYSSRPAGEKDAKILGYKFENKGHQYQYAYETENGISAQENGQTAEHGTSVHGAYAYTGDDGKVYSVTYTADENGYHPQGEHLPTPPPVPEAIQKSLEQNARDEVNGVYDDGKYRSESGHGSSQGSAQGYQQYEGGYQNLGYQGSSGHEASAELGYHNLAGYAGQASGAELAYQGYAGNAGHESSGQAVYHLANQRVHNSGYPGHH